MTREEFAVIVKGMKAVYAYNTFIPDVDAFNVWYGLLSDLPYEIATRATQAFLMTHSKPPTIADIRELAAEMQTEPQDNDSEAWDKVYRALCNSTYNSEAEFAKLPPLVQKAVGSASQLRQWAIDENFNAGVESSNFKKVYRQVQEREKKRMQISPDIAGRLEEIRERTKLLE